MKVNSLTYIKRWIVNIVRYILLIVLLPVVIIYIIFSMLNRYKENHKIHEKITIFNMSQLDTLSGEEFENLLKSVFENLGYNVSLTKKSHDYGADLILTKNKTSILVQAKCYSKTVGIKSVQEIVAARPHYNVADVMVATNNYFSKEAINLAEENNVKLIDRDLIERLIKKYNIKISPQNKKCQTLTDADKNELIKKYPHWI